MSETDVPCPATWPLSTPFCLLSLCFANLRPSRTTVISGKNCTPQCVAPYHSLVPCKILPCVCLSLLAQRMRFSDPYFWQHHSLEKSWKPRSETDWFTKLDWARSWTTRLHIPRIRKNREPSLGFPDRLPIAGVFKHASKLLPNSTVWLHTHDIPKLLPWAMPRFRAEEEGARNCAEKFHHAQVGNNRGWISSSGTIYIGLHGISKAS